MPQATIDPVKQAPDVNEIQATPRRELPHGESLTTRLAAIKAADNPLLEAARPLLRALADMPEYLDHERVEQLRDLLEQEVRAFQKLCEQTSIRRDHMLGTRYCLCTAIDEAAMQTAWGKNSKVPVQPGQSPRGKDAGAAASDINNHDAGVEWVTRGMATIFHEDRQGGDKVYLLIGRLMSDPQEHLDLLEVIYRILSLGFEGRYRFEAGGHRKHEAVRQRIYNEIMARRGIVPVALSPHWQSDVKGRRASFYDFPVWITVTLLSVILLGCFGWFKYELLGRSAEVQKQIADIGHMTPPPAPPVLHLKALLKDEIAAGTVSVDEDAHHSSVTFRGDSMFPPGGASVKATMGPLIAKIAAEIARVPGKVSVLGYTDNVPIRSRQFASNDALSEERATQVMQILQAAGVPASRLEAVGKGDADPVADNSTPQGRAQNRRVEITVAEYTRP
ncbi:type VI secretion system protein TssL, long form [Paraburkholderia phymatum]|uniref:Type VI secretion system OmpA/MotB family protein n=1 Tax=Paraburkholderia phymatum (strain DSM 17167 / CIP 108236 / LMG 21445 / STM815) TaxID=391038 RepID=B2JW39_PARP8|nr:type VI secretion system protein TssL, long form [Paraburkholderia phymatum]ACC75166.1 type VI secretion system OmpA/MotB family protein [Paraburkholderia phymatum STM815]